jgi:hypothetical protein
MTALATEMAYAAGLQVILEYDRYCAVGNRKKVLAWSAHLDAKAYSHIGYSTYMGIDFITVERRDCMDYASTNLSLPFSHYLAGEQKCFKMRLWKAFLGL